MNGSLVKNIFKVLQKNTTRQSEEGSSKAKVGGREPLRDRTASWVVLEAVRRRLKDCKLELHPEKTRIVHCKDDRRRRGLSAHKFDFLGNTFRPRTSRMRG
jgi:hypothetical protein